MLGHKYLSPDFFQDKKQQRKKLPDSEKVIEPISFKA